VIVSVFAKAADKERSTIGFDSELLHLDINLPGSKRFNKTLDLFGPINTEASSFQILKTKVFDTTSLDINNKTYIHRLRSN
jgi:hypothetical protein